MIRWLNMKFSKNLLNQKRLINILNFKMESTNKRILQGTGHSIKTTDVKLGGDFSITTKPEFLQRRNKIWESLFTKQDDYLKSLPREKIIVTLKNGKQVEGISFETTPLQIAKGNLKKSLIPDFIVAKVKYSRKVIDLSSGLVCADEDEHHTEPTNFELWDLSRPLDGDCEIEYCTIDDKEGKTVFWHSSAHILGSSLEHTYGSYLCIGPPLEEGFYYDCYMGKSAVDEKDYPKIEDSAKSVITANHPYNRLTLTKAEALELFGDNPFKVQLISNKIPENGKTTAYRCGDLIDLCMGPHLISTGVVKSFKVTKNSSCYWLGNANHDSLQRVYAISFPSAKEMEEYTKRKHEEEKRDHRNIAKQQDLFMFHTLSPGSCFFYPHGAYVYNKLVAFIRKEYLIRGFSEVISPNIFNLRLWKTSGHYKNYKENMFMVKIENQGFGLKPMNCPGHCLMFDNKARSYKELPIRYADFGVLHRNEISGALSGLTRVRRFQQDDAHIFCAPDQIQQEVMGQLQFLEYVYKIFGFEYELFLSTKPENGLGSNELWDQAEKGLADALNQFGKPWKLNPGDGAFYGPKIDIKLFDAIKRHHQCGTIQLDFQLPIRFNLSYRTDEKVIKTEEEKEGEKKEVKQKKHKKGDKKEEKKEENGEVKVDEVKVLEKKAELVVKADSLNSGHGGCCGREVYNKDEWDEEEFVWEEQPLRAGYKRPVIIHRAILGSCERLLAILIEHYAGKWPFWISPRQAIILTVSDTFNEYAEKIHKRLSYEGFQVSLDKGGHTLQKKIVLAEKEEYNYILVIGNEEMSANSVDVRSRERERLGKYTIDNLIVFFKSLEPAVSEKEVELVKNMYKVPKSESNLDTLEERLKKNLFLNGNEVSEEDLNLYTETYKDVEISCDSHPNIFKWKKIVELTQSLKK